MTWDELCSKVKTGADVALEMIHQTTDLATLRVKLSMAEHRLKEAYAVLGRAAYRYFSEKTVSAETIAEAMAAVEKEKAAVDAIKAQIKKCGEAQETNEG
ncbi:MAG: hypothetical protein IKJ35_02445 [Clostridia bacterium]|nr:hypothetical protein [Clostridia bacterium]